MMLKICVTESEAPITQGNHGKLVGRAYLVDLVPPGNSLAFMHLYCIVISSVLNLGGGGCGTQLQHTPSLGKRYSVMNNKVGQKL